MFEKNLNISLLLDFYGDILTERQSDMLSLYYNEEFLSLTKAYEDNLINKEFLQDLAFIHNQNTYFKLVDLYPLLNELVDDYSKVNYIHKNYFKYSYSTIEQSHYSDDSYIIKVILDKIMNVKLTVTNII
jgi:predicted DNA-binding protein YlxM (UPF0122 family)